MERDAERSALGGVRVEREEERKKKEEEEEEKNKSDEQWRRGSRSGGDERSRENKERTGKKKESVDMYLSEMNDSESTERERLFTRASVESNLIYREKRGEKERRKTKKVQLTTWIDQIQ